MDERKRQEEEARQKKLAAEQQNRWSESMTPGERQLVGRYQKGEIDLPTLQESLSGNVSRPGGIQGALGKYGPQLGPQPDRGGGILEGIQRVTTPFLTPATEYLPPSARPERYIRKVPVVGEVAAPMIGGLTSLVGLAGVAAFPLGVTARMTGYGIAGGVAGQLAEKTGAPVAQVGPVRVGPRAVGELAGTIVGPTLGPVAERAAARGAVTAAEAVSPKVQEFRNALLRSNAPLPRLMREEAGQLGPLGSRPEELMTKITAGKALTPEEELLLRQPEYRAAQTAYQEAPITRVTPPEATVSEAPLTTPVTGEGARPPGARPPSAGGEVPPLKMGEFAPAGKPPGFVAKNVQARLAEMDANTRIEEIPGRLTPAKLRQKFPTLSGFIDQVEESKATTLNARTRLKQLRSVYAENASIPGREGLVPEAGVTQAEKDLKAAVKARTEAKKALGAAEIRVGMKDIAQRARAAGADEGTVSIIQKSYEDANKLIPREEDLLSASEIRQRAARIQATIEGTPPGVVGQIANKEEMLVSAIRQYESKQVQRIGEGLDALTDELPNITYVGPKKFLKEATTYKDKVLVQHPEWFTGVSPKSQAILDEMQVAQRSKVAVAHAMGYKIEAIEGPYLEQMWDIPKSVLESPVYRIPGKVSIAKDRLFGDYIEGIRHGFTPKEMTLRELYEHSTSLANQMIGQSFERRLILERFGRRATQPLTSGYRRFGHPLYRGWYGPSPVTSWIDQLHNPSSSLLRPVQDVAQTMRNTVFGPVDVAVFGVQMLDSVGTGGPRAFGAFINRSLELLHLPNVALYAEETGLKRSVQAAMDGVVQNIGPSSVTLKGGTVIKYIPKIGKYLDAPVSGFVDKITQIQFGVILKWWRNLNYEGNLLSLHLTGEDITNPAVRRVAADTANAWTGASRGAMVPGRRGVESTLLTSMQMPRSEVARLGQIAKAVTLGATPAERKMALMTLATFAGMVYGLGSAINMAFGNGPIEFDPRNGNWATVKVGGQKMALVSRAALIRAMGKSVTTIEEAIKGDPAQTADLARIWAQVGLAKVGPAPGTVTGALGFGFEPGTGQFQVGTLSAKGRLLNLLPMPPTVEQMVTEPESRSPLAVAANVLGVRTWPVSPYEHLNELVPGWDKMIDAQRKEEAAKNPEVRKWWDKQLQQGVGRGQEWAQFKQGQQEQDADAEQKLLALYRNPQATHADVSGAYSDYLQKRATLSQDQYGDSEQDPRSDLERRMDAYYAVGPTEFMTGIDRDAAFSQQDAILEADPELKQAILSGRILRWPSAEGQALVAEIENAKDVQNQYFAIPRKRGISLEEQNELGPYVSQIYAYMGQGMNRLRAVREVTADHDLRMRLLRYLRRPVSPESRRFKTEHQEELGWFEALPFDEEGFGSEETELALAS